MDEKNEKKNDGWKERKKEKWMERKEKVYNKD